MTNKLTLDDLNASVERKYAPVSVDIGDGDPVVLRGLIRLGEKDRQTVTDNMKLLSEIRSGVDDMSAEDQSLAIEALNEVLLVLAEKGGTRLVSAIATVPEGRRLALMTQILEEWMESTQLGEAKSSPNS